MTDIEIAKNAKIEEITNIAKKNLINEEDLETYGKYKAKISDEFYKKNRHKKDGKLILVTAISPTPLGEGKTTISIGLADGLAKIGKKSVLALREPSLGPVFGVKGGATGGGYAQIVPMEDINLHFTGDIHAITAANNLLSAMIDNHIFAGNALNIDKIIWKRCIDMNDRTLRKIQIGLSGEKGLTPREDGFDITAASEIMAILCLSEDLNDLKSRLGKIIIGYNIEGKPVTAHDLKAEGALTVLLKEAIKPTLVQTLENNPALIHGGPFANIAHGCNSIIATKTALKLGEYVVTEAGFGADLGAEKFLDIKSRVANIKPNAIVCVATIKALKYRAGVAKEDILKENVEALKNGMSNIITHIDNLKNKFGANVIVAINRFKEDTDEEIKCLENELNKIGVELSLVEAWGKGGEGAKDLAKKVVLLCDEETNIKYVYDFQDSITEKVTKVAREVYRASNVEFSEEAINSIKQIENLGYGNLPICIAKTQFSFSDDAKNLLCEEPFVLHVKDAILKAGAGFVVILAGKIMTMPGLPKVPAAESIDIDENGEIVGLF